MKDIADYLVVGSGCSGAMAAQTLVEAGVKVTMLDTGYTKSPESSTIPDKDFLDIRANDKAQHNYLIGPNAEGVGWGKIGKGEQITPPRKHIMQGVEKYIPLTSKTFSSVESLGYGGLGIGWGLQSWEYSKPDLIAAGLDYERMSEAYNVVADRIGISATSDDAADYTIGTLANYQPSASMDRNHKLIYRRYEAKKSLFNAKGFIMGRTPLALITKNKDGRKKYAYRDMDFYSDNDKSAWRPWITVDTLKKAKNFTYVGGYLVLKFSEKKSHTEVHCINIKSNQPTVFYCKKLILATGALGSARIVLRSLGKPNTQLPLLCNPYSYVPCVQPRLVGKAAVPKKLGFTQLSLFLDKDKTGANSSVASIYSYQSLMLFRLIRHVPLNFVDAKKIIRYLLSGIVIMGIHHPDSASKKKYVTLVPSPDNPTKDSLKVGYELNEHEKAEYAKREKEFMKAIRKMGAWPLKKIDPGYGASIHYAGTLPFSQQAQPLHLSPSGKLYGTTNVYVADSSGFTYLPAQGLTFSLMANAHNTARSALEDK